MKKVVLFLIVWAAMAFGGCTPSQPSDGRTQIRFWTISLSPTYDVYLQGLIDQFERENPSIELLWTDLPQAATRQKLMAGIAAGDPPDLVNLDTEFTLVLAQNGALTDLTELVSKDEREQYFPNLWEAGGYGGGTYAVPWYVTTRVIMMNAQLMKEAGLDPEQAPKTWDELDADARQVSKRTKAVGLMPPIKIVNDWSMAGAPVVDEVGLRPLFTDPASVAVLERYHRLYSEKVMPPETLTEGYRGALDRYKAGSLAFLEAGPQFLLRIKADAPSVYEQTRLAPLPATQAGTVPAATMNFAVPRSSKHRDIAVKLALFLTSPKAQLEFAKLVPLLPSTIESTQDPFFREGGEDRLQSEAVRISIAQLPDARDFSLALPRQKDLSRSLNAAVEKAIRGEATSQQALDEAARDWEKTLAPFRTD